MNALLLLDDGRTAGRLAAALFIAAETVQAHRRFMALPLRRSGFVCK
jgi:hypothetical protein